MLQPKHYLGIYNYPDNYGWYVMDDLGNAIYITSNHIHQLLIYIKE